MALCASGTIMGQGCIMDGLYGEEVNIEDETVTRFRLAVRNSALATIGPDTAIHQDICGIRLNFRHQRVSDLEIKLVAPNGSEVILVGPIDINGPATFLFGADHDITFRSAFLIGENPDPGFDFSWTNLEINWGGGPANLYPPPYTGVYQPYQGNLRGDFDGSAVDGIWEIVVRDGLINDQGIFREFEIEFCDPNLDCIACNPRAGSFQTNDISICENEFYDIPAIYNSDSFDSIAYSDEFLVFQNGNFQGIYDEQNFNSTHFGTGQFVIYGVNVLEEDVDVLADSLSPLTESQIIAMIDSQDNYFCVARSDSLLFTIQSQADTIRLNRTLCAGEFTVLFGDTLAQTGVYIRDNGSCDSIVELTLITSDLTLQDLPNVVFVDCTADTIEIAAVYSSSDPVNVVWEDALGQTVGTDSILKTAETGQYSIFISDGICNFSSDVHINDPRDTMVLNIDRDLDELTCSDSVITMQATANFQLGTILWILGNDTLSTTDILNATTTGQYAVVASDINGCEVANLINVSGDRTIPQVNFIGDTILNCRQTQVLISDASTETVSGEWYNPNGDTILGKNININEPGTYLYQGLSANGCTVLESIEILIDTLVPVLNLPDAVFLNCNMPTTSIDIPSQSDIESVTWLQNGNSVVTNNYQVNIGGTIEATITGTNGCTDIQSINVQVDQEMPDISLVGDTLDCNNPMVEVRTNNTAEAYTYQWSGDIVNGQGTEAVQVNTAGLLQLEVQDTSNGCVNMSSIQVQEDFTTPTFDTLIITRTLRCDFEVGRIYVSPVRDAMVSITDNNGVETSGNEITITEGGDYIIRLTGTNGCVDERTESIIDLRAPVDFDIDPNYNITCLDPTALVEPTQVGTDVDLTWIYNNGDSIVGSSQIISNGELMSVYAIDSIGCDTLIPLNINVDTAGPVAEIISDKVLSCDGDPITLLSRETDISIYALAWNGDSIRTLADQSELLVTNSGDYNLMVVDRASGCFNLDTIHVDLSSMPLSSIVFSKNDESCNGANDGDLVIDDVVGGVGAINAAINGMPVPDLELTNLSPGTYDIQIVDQIACKIDTTLTILEGADYMLDLGGDQTVNRGNQYVIRPEYSGDLPISITYSNEDGVLSNNIDSLLLLPTSDQRIFAISESENGCFSSDSVFIDLFTSLDQIELYVPNIMALNSNNGNGILSIELTEDIIRVNNFSIYDRWGQRVCHLEELNSIGPTVIWDGKYGGSEVASGVYVYSYEILTNIDNQTKVVVGDITVLR